MQLNGSLGNHQDTQRRIMNWNLQRRELFASLRWPENRTIALSLNEIRIENLKSYNLAGPEYHQVPSDRVEVVPNSFTGDTVSRSNWNL